MTSKDTPADAREGAGIPPTEDVGPQRADPSPSQPLRRFRLAAVGPRPRSWVWFALPVFVGIIGGAIAYYALRLDSPRMARDCLYIGMMLTAVNAAVLSIAVLSAAIPLGIGLDQGLEWGMSSADDELRACLDGVPGLDGMGAPIDTEMAMKCFREHAQDARGAPPSLG